MVESALVGAIDRLGKEVTSLTVIIRRRTDSFARVLWQLRVMGVLMLVSMLGLVVNAGYGRYVSAQIQSATQPGGEIYEKAQERSKGVIVGLVVEQDCRARRMYANLPAPDPTKSCQEQTPTNVYPGEGGK